MGVWEGVHGLQTSNEGINQRNLKIWADVADKICFGRTQQLGMGVMAISSPAVRSPWEASNIAFIEN